MVKRTRTCTIRLFYYNITFKIHQQKVILEPIIISQSYEPSIISTQQILDNCVRQIFQNASLWSLVNKCDPKVLVFEGMVYLSSTIMHSDSRQALLMNKLQYMGGTESAISHIRRERMV